MRAKLLLANSAEVRESLLYILGGGWDQIGPNPQPFAITGYLEIEWDETNRKHEVEILVEDEDGKPLMVQAPSGEYQPLKIGSAFTAGRPPTAPVGTSFNVPLAIPIVALPWTPGKRYVVTLKVNGNQLDRLIFTVRPLPPSGAVRG